MKKTIVLLFVAILFSQCNQILKKPTALVVKNNSDTLITAYLTVGGGQGWANKVTGIFGISDTTAQGSFILHPGDSVIYSSIKPIQGNISFAYPPLNCPIGTTIYEFCLNNFGTVKDAQETVDISCVAGVSSIGSFKLSGGGEWSATTEYPNVTSITNDTIGANSGIVGVYPYGCTTCTGTLGVPTCIITPEKAQVYAICNVQRYSKYNGGIVVIQFNKLAK